MKILILAIRKPSELIMLAFLKKKARRKDSGGEEGPTA